jgi:hypothetical protein
MLRAVKLLIALEFAYLVLVNAALQLDITQNLVNRIRPEKFHVAWENAWSWYPFHVNARDIRAHGQSRTQQWEVRADAASGNIALLPLLAKRVNISSVDALNVAYRQRPRLKADRDYSAVQAYFPDIGDRALAPVDTSARKHKRPWRIALKQGVARGQIDYWIYNLRGSADGSALVDLSYRTQGGAFSLDVRDIDLQVAPAFLNNDSALTQGGTVSGRLAFAPFVPRKNRGVKMLPFLETDAQLDLFVPSLAFINLFTGNLGDLLIEGAGHVRGRLHYARGFVLSGTDLWARAQGLSVHASKLQALGEGAVHLSTPQQEDEPLTLAISYDTFTVIRDGDPDPFLSGDGLNLAYSGSNYVVPDEGLNFDTLVNSEQYRARREHSTLLLGVEDATLLDMAVLNDYLPADTSFQFTGGTASLDADVFAGFSDIKGGLQLRGSELGMRARGEDLEGDLAVDLVLAGGVPREMRVKIDGSSITLDKVSVAGEKQSFDDQLWSAQVMFERAEAVFGLPVWLSADAALTVSDTRPLVALFENRSISPVWLSKLLTIRDIDGEATLEMSDNQLRVTDAQVLSDKAEVAVKALFYEKGSDGVVYVRYRKLDAVLKMDGEESNLDVLGARQTFEQYRLR